MRIVLAQMVFALAALSAMVLIPPANGEMRLVGFAGERQRIAVALASDARIVRWSPDGTLVVHGARGALFAQAVREGLVPIAARDAACGDRIA